MPGPLSKLLRTESGETKPLGLVVVVFVLVGAGAALGYYVWTGGVGGEAQIENPMRCAACGYTESRTPKPGDEIPAACPKCDEKKLYPAYTCPKCKTLVILNEYSGAKPPTKCPKCGAEVRHGG